MLAESSQITFDNLSEINDVDNLSLCVAAVNNQTSIEDDNIHVKGFGNIVGEIKQNKDDTDKLVMSNTARILLNYEEPKSVLNDIKSISEKIKDVMYGSVFTSKRVATDEFTDIYYDSDEDEDKEDEDGHFVCYKTIDGCFNFVHFPGGGVILHSSNLLLFDCLNIEYMIYKNCIPISATNFDTNSVYKRFANYVTR